jgi:putative ABC transport system ATP-binding protein
MQLSFHRLNQSQMNEASTGVTGHFETSSVTLESRPSLVYLSQLRKEYANAEVTVQALRGISLAITPGEFVAIMGASGSGKSTLMNILGCLDQPTSGLYFLDGNDVGKFNHDQLADLRNRKLGFVFQGFNLLSRRTAVENVELPLLCGAGARKRPKNSRARAMERLAQVGLVERATHFPNQLSGGQQQRVAIARALVNEPHLILADEPTGNLDSKTSVEVIEIFQKLNDSGMTILMVTHEQYMARFCKRSLLIHDGVLVRDQVLSATERLSATEELDLAKERESDT